MIIFAYSVLNSSLGLTEENHDWKSDWALEDYFSIEIDTTGYSFPSAIAFVPSPRDGPKDPLYFVTELRGKLKVVTNDRTVYTFAEDFFKQHIEKELPSAEGEIGMAGICLEPENGYIFATFSYHDENGILRNNIMRFETEPEVFSLKPNSMMDFGPVFVSDESAQAHQIGPCQINDNLLYVSVGDGYEAFQSQNLDSTLGKIIRMTLDGKPSEQNPFYSDDGTNSARDYVWAYGFRNPFSLKIVDDRVFVADNGRNNDRFLEVHEGENYLWDGTDLSIATNSDVVFAPATGPVQMDYYPKSLDIFPVEYRKRFYLALSGETWLEGPSERGGKSIIMLDYGFEENKMIAPPKYLLKYRGNGMQILVGLAIGPDGLYFTPLYPDLRGQSHVLKVKFDSANTHQYSIKEETRPELLLAEYGCLGCHTLYGQGGKAAPVLDSEELKKRLSGRLNSPEYISTVTELDSLDIEPAKSFKEKRQEVLNASGDERIRIWTKYHILEPKFDNPDSQMPNMGLSEKEAQILTDVLLKQELVSGDNKLHLLLKTYIPELRYRYLIYSFILGCFLSLLFFSAIYFLNLRKR